MHLIRGADDPTETAPRGGGQRGTRSNNPGGVNRRRWDEALRELLHDGTPRTFNRIAIELTGRTADVMFQTALDKTLWTMVERGEVECTSAAPVLFRRLAVPRAT